MRLQKIFFLLLILPAFLGGCKKILSPEEDFHITFDRVYNVQDPEAAAGVLSQAYVRMPVNS
jgi:hypothetical protein